MVTAPVASKSVLGHLIHLDTLYGNLGDCRAYFVSMTTIVTLWMNVRVRAFQNSTFKNFCQ